MRDMQKLTNLKEYTFEEVRAEVHQYKKKIVRYVQDISDTYFVVGLPWQSSKGHA